MCKTLCEWIKLNVDRCMDLFCAFAYYYVNCNNNLAEDKPIHRGILLCIIKSLSNVIVKFDFMFCAKIGQTNQEASSLREGHSTTGILANLGQQ